MDQVAREWESTRNYGWEAFSVVVKIFLAASLFAAAVVPHTFQAGEAVLFLATAVLSLCAIKKDPWLTSVMTTYFMGVVVTVVYIWVGYAHGAPREASNQTLFVYVVSPLAWILISTALFQLIGLVSTVRMLIWLTWAAMFSVAAFFYLFLTFGKGAVEFLTEDANVNVSGGFAGATILVYGSLIFLSGALFAQPDLIKNRLARILLPAGLILCALTSGRSALILAVPVGFVVGAILRSRMRESDRAAAPTRSIILPTILLGIVGVCAIALIDFLLTDLDLTVIFGQFFDELSSGGGDVRAEQSAALWEGFLKTYGVGAGHGIGVSYLRNFIYPWRYEVMPLATLYRVGVIGAVIYASTFILYGQAFLRRWTAKDLGPEDIYMTGGCVAVGLAVATNPYIESFVFQWMYFVPIMSIGIRSMDRRSTQVSASNPLA